MTTSSYDWIRKINPELKMLDRIPLTGNAPSFSWDQLSARLAKIFEREGLTIKPGQLTWRSKEELYEGIGAPLFPLFFSIPSLQGEVNWVIAEQEMELLAALLLTKESHPLSFQDVTLKESFFRFFALEVLYNFTQVYPDKALIPILIPSSALPQQASLCLDISLTLQEHTVWSRLIISPEFRHSWVEYFTQKQEPSDLTKQMAQLVDVIIHVEAGKTQFSLAEWSAVQVGDLVVLDSCSLNPENLEGRVMLTINGRQAFRAKLKDGNLKILELPLFHEVNTPMAKQSADDDEDDLSDLDFSENENLEDEDLEDEDLEGDFEDEDLFEDTENELFTEEGEEETPLISKEPSRKKEEHVTVVSPSKQGPITPEQIPIVLTVEVGQIQMTMDQLLKLEPGNLLELAIHPEKGVDLTVNGKVIGKGELIRIGETLGVRVLQLGR